jgi:hypothetical protein
MVYAIPKLIITCNNAKFTQYEHAKERRIVFFNWKYVFFSNPDPSNPHQMPLDHTLGVQLKRTGASEYMLSLLAKAAARAVCDSNVRTMPNLPI